MVSSLFAQIEKSSDAMLREQYLNLRTQVPLMYVLMFINSAFLSIVTYGDVPIALSIGVPAILSIIIAARSAMWVARRRTEVPADAIRRYLRGTLVASALLSAGFGGWGLLLFNDVDPMRATAIALYIFVGSISCCYCLQALPVAGWCVLLFGASPVTVRLLLSSDWYLAGVGLTFLLVASVILRTLATSHAALKQILQTRSEMGELITALQHSEEHYRYSVDLNPQIPWLANANGEILDFGARWASLTGMSLKNSLGAGWIEAVHPADLPAVQDAWAQALAARRGELADVRYRLRQADGTYRWNRARAWPRLDREGNVITWYGNLEDIEDQVAAERALQESEERYRLASLASNDVIWDVALAGDHISWSSAAATVWGYPEALDGTSRAWWLDHIHPDDREDVIAQFANLHDPSLTQWTDEFRFLAADGRYLDMVARGNVVRDQDGNAIRLIGALQDVSDQKHYEGQLRRAAHYDSLTKLPNRVLFAERLESALAKARLNGDHVGLAVLDVDRFKTINDSLGHDVGDALLCEIADRLKRDAPPTATVARLGGDEFAIIHPGLKHDARWPEIVEKLLAGLTSAMLHDGREIEVSLSVGVALAFSDGDSSEALHKSADLALYAAKNEGLGHIGVFKRHLREAAERETQMLADARNALQEGRVLPFYQPKICLRTGALTGFEALLRWHRLQGIQQPASIRAAFEDAGMSVQLTNRMLDCVIADMLRWRDQGLDFGCIAVNGSPGDFRRGDFAERILERLHHAGLPPSALELEVTESVFLGQIAENVSRALTILSKAGVNIALDDFGTGYASLTHLKQFPVNTIKIDRSFVSRLGLVETEDAAIVGAVIDLARSLGISTVAEGIETPAQLGHLMVKGCDVGQGFLLGKPMAAKKVVETISGWNASAILDLCGPGDWGPAAQQIHSRRFP